jgi:hypothetical protein
MTKEKKEVTPIDPAMINKQELMDKFTQITDNLLQMEAHREHNNEIVKDIKTNFGFKPSAIRAAANALYKRKREELEEKQEEKQFQLINSDHRKAHIDAVWAFSTYEAVKAYDALTAFVALPLKLPVIPLVTVSEPVIIVIEPLEYICELSKWSPPSDRGTYHKVKFGSSPKDPVLRGPESNIPPVYVDPLTF